MSLSTNRCAVSILGTNKYSDTPLLVLAGSTREFDVYGLYSWESRVAYVCDERGSVGTHDEPEKCTHAQSMYFPEERKSGAVWLLIHAMDHHSKHHLLQVRTCPVCTYIHTEESGLHMERRLRRVFAHRCRNSGKGAFSYLHSSEKG